jgi:ribosomal protein L5
MEATVTTPQAAPPARLRERYEQELLPALTKKFGYSTPMEAPRLLKITLNMGLGTEKQDTKSFEAAPGSTRTCAGPASRSLPSSCARGCRSASR